MTEWTIDAIVHALPSPELRQQALRDIHLAPEDELAAAVAKWRAVAVRWVAEEAPRIEAARTVLEQTGHAPAEYAEETEESRAAHDAWRARMRAARQERGAA